MIAVYGFPIHQGFAHNFHFIAVFIKDFVGYLILLIQDAANFCVDVLLGFFGNILRTGNAASQEYFVFVFRINHYAHFIAHTVTGNHLARHLGGTFEIVGCTGRNTADEDVFGNASAKQNRQLAQHLVFIHADTVAFRKLPSQTERTTARHDGHFVNRVGKRQAFGNNRMTCFMVGGRTFFVFVHYHAAAFGTHIDFVFGIFKIALVDFDFVAAACKQGGFVDQVRQICAGEAGCAPCQ